MAPTSEEPYISECVSISLSVCLKEVINSHCRTVYHGLVDFPDKSTAPHNLILVIWNFKGTWLSLWGYLGVTLMVLQAHFGGTLKQFCSYSGVNVRVLWKHCWGTCSRDRSNPSGGQITGPWAQNILAHLKKCAEL